MKTFKLLIFLSALLAAGWARAQLPVACGGGSTPAIGCELACISCNFDGYTGSTEGFPSVQAPNFCGTVENAQWLGFIAGAEQATFTIFPFNCADGNGVQVALYQDCQGAPLACDKGEKDGANIPVTITVAVSPGSNYFLMIDGYAGDQCEFTVDITPKEAVYEPALGMVQEISGPSEGCPGAVFTYTVQPVDGAGAYLWDGPPGTLVNGDSVPVSVLGQQGRTVTVTLGPTSGNICVQAANSCEINPPCASSMWVNVLGDKDRPQIGGDTLAGLNCFGSPVTLSPVVSPAGAYQYVWSSDSTGVIEGGGLTATPQVSAAGVYTVRVTNPLTGCTREADFRVTDPERPVPALISLRPISCYGAADGIVTLVEGEAGVPPYLYSLNEGPLQLVDQFRYLGPGVYDLLVQDAYGCEWDTTLSLTEPPELLIDLGLDTAIALGNALSLWAPEMVNFPDRIHRVEVRPASLSPYLCDTCRYCPPNSFRYHIMVTDSAGCRAEDAREVVVGKTRDVFIPNVIKPGTGSDQNAFFEVFCGPAASRIQLLEVYDRWGHKVFERRDFAPGDKTGAWDGTVAGQMALPAVYLYYAEVLFKDGETVPYRGDVTVFR